MAKKNYHVTFSDSGTNDQDQLKAMAAGANVAVVFKDKLPSTWMSRKVIDGDAHDLRFKDCLLYTSPSPRDGLLSRMPSSA